MKLTKFEHACFVLESEGKSLVVDPGGYTRDFAVPDDVVAIVITHEHGDHISIEHIESILAKNEGVKIFAHESITNTLEAYDAQAVSAGDTMQVEGFKLEFFGGEHARIFPDVAPIPNVGVLINDNLYYPGDSFALPTKPIKTLALPVAAPWQKASEVITYLRDIPVPLVVFPTHDAIYSRAGKALADKLFGPVVQDLGAKYIRIEHSLDI